MKQDQVTPAIDRVFRTYHRYCTAFDEDSLFQLLTALHSLDDRLKPAHGRVLFAIPEYIALKALRNHFHHGAEIRNLIRFKSVAGLGLTTDLTTVCLIAFNDAIAAIKGTKKEFQAQTAEAMAATFKDWGIVVDINPCVANCVVKVFEALLALGLSGTAQEFFILKASYDHETRHGLPHYMTGAVCLRASDISKYQRTMEALYNH